MSIQEISKLLIFLSLIFLFVNLSHAEELKLDYPDEIEQNKEFIISIELIDFPQNTYDVKIDINPENRIARILNNNQWKSTFYYINDAIQKQEDFTLKITEQYTGTANILIKLRSDEVITFSGYSINIIKEDTEKEEQNADTEEKNTQEQDKQDDEDNQEENNKENLIDNKQENKDITENTNQNTRETKTIRLNYNKEKITYENKQKYIPYLLFFISIFLVMLYFLIHKLKH